VQDLAQCLGIKGTSQIRVEMHSKDSVKLSGGTDPISASSVTRQLR